MRTNPPGEVQVLDEDLGLHLAYFIRSAAGAEIDQPDTSLNNHVFAVAGRKLVVRMTDRLTGNYLLKLFQELRSYVAEAAHQVSFDEGIQAIAAPLREDLIRRLQQEAFWREDEAL